MSRQNQDQKTLELILPEGIHFEMILITLDRQGRPNAAPVGVARSGQQIFIDLAEDTASVRNMDQRSPTVLNLVLDPLIFAQAAFNQVPNNAFTALEAMPTPIIDGAFAVILLHRVSRKDFVKDDDLGPTKFVRSTFKGGDVRILRPPRPPSRRIGSLIEAIIAVTKAEVAARRGMIHLLPKYRESVLYHCELGRGTGGDRAEEALAMCMRRLDAIMMGRCE